MSAQTRLFTSIENSRSAWASFIPPRPTQGCSSSATRRTSSAAICVPALSTNSSLTRTRRAMISDWAFVRVSTRPRSTRATSRRCLAGIRLPRSLTDGVRQRICRVIADQELADTPGDAIRMEVVLRSEHVLRSVVHVFVGNPDAMELDALETELLRLLHYGRAEAPRQRSLFDRQHVRARLAETPDQLLIERLDEARVHDGDLDALFRENVRCLHRRPHFVADREDR